MILFREGTALIWMTHPWVSYQLNEDMVYDISHFQGGVGSLGKLYVEFVWGEGEAEKWWRP
jgi:hypothetical protein